MYQAGQRPSTSRTSPTNAADQDGGGAAAAASTARAVPRRSSASRVCLTEQPQHSAEHPSPQDEQAVTRVDARGPAHPRIRAGKPPGSRPPAAALACPRCWLLGLPILRRHGHGQEAQQGLPEGDSRDARAAWVGVPTEQVHLSRCAARDARGQQPGQRLPQQLQRRTRARHSPLRQRRREQLPVESVGGQGSAGESDWRDWLRACHACGARRGVSGSTPNPPPTHPREVPATHPTTTAHRRGADLAGLPRQRQQRDLQQQLPRRREARVGSLGHHSRHARGCKARWAGGGGCEQAGEAAQAKQRRRAGQGAGQ